MSRNIFVCFFWKCRATSVDRTAGMEPMERKRMPSVFLTMGVACDMVFSTIITSAQVLGLYRCLVSTTRQRFFY